MKAHLVEVEQVAYSKRDQLVDWKRVFKGVDRNNTKRLKLFKDQFVLELNNSHPKLFPWRLSVNGSSPPQLKRVRK